MKNKNLLLLSLAFIMITASIFVSCKKEEFSEEDVYSEQKEFELLRDSLRTVGGVINYSVAVVDGSNSSWSSDMNKSTKGAKGLATCFVTVSQNGVTLTDSTDASGIASFDDLRIGTVNVNIRRDGYTDVDFVAVIPGLADTSFVQAYDVYRQVGTMVPVFSTTSNLSTITGVATVEKDLTNTAPEVAGGVTLTARIDIENGDFSDRYIYFMDDEVEVDGDFLYYEFDYYAGIRQMAYNDVVSKTTTDETTGEFSLTVPSSPDGLPIVIEASDFVADQTLLLPAIGGKAVFGTQTVRTIFGKDYEGTTLTYSTLPALGVSATTVQSAYVTFTAPDGTPAPQPTTQATATAVLASSGIVSVNITNPGDGYTQAPRVLFSQGTGWNSVQAEGTATISNGKVTGVTITDAGTGYKPTDIVTINFVENVDVTAVATPIFSYSLKSFNVTGGGTGYTLGSPPAITINGDGTGGSATAVLGGTITDINMTATGSGYTQKPTVFISDGKGNNTTINAASINMTDANPIANIDYNSATPPAFDATPTPTVTIIGGGGSGATAEATLSSTGPIATNITINDGGAGYTNPTVTISGGGSWAEATATVAGGVITAITVTSQGGEFTSAPTVTITEDPSNPAPTTNASATAVVTYELEAITLTNGGSGYSSNPATVRVEQGATIVNVAGDCTFSYSMGVEDITPDATVFEAEPTFTILPVDGNGSGATASADINWAVNDIIINNIGSGYTYTPQITIAPPTNGTVATATATLGRGVLKEVIIDNPGTGYTAAPHLEIYNAGMTVNVVNEAQMSATVADGQITAIAVDDPGSDYTYSTNYTVNVSTYNSGAAATANPNPSSGTIEFIQIDNPGAGYSVTPQIIINNNGTNGDANGFGSGAAATATVVDGRVTAIEITDGGSGYYAVPDVDIVVPSYLQTAEARCIVSTEGHITGVDFTAYNGFGTAGMGYATAPTVTFTPSVEGMGSGATGVAVLNDDGTVQKVIMTNQGQGYLGKNYAQYTNFSVIPANSSASNLPIISRAGKTYVRDVHFGIGKRTTD